MCKSMGEAMVKHKPVVLWSGVPPRELIQVQLKHGEEKAALELLEKLGFIRLLWYSKSGSGV